LKNKVVILGAGPSGLFAAYLLLEKGFEVDLYDHSSGPGKKFLVAGNGGLNLTHSEPLTEFEKKYSNHSGLFSSLLSDFSPKDLRDFCQKLGVETFVGSSGRVFPKMLNAASMMRNWIDVLKRNKKFSLFLNHRLVDIKVDNSSYLVELFDLRENEKSIIECKKLILGLGGGSWKKTGSDGAWVSILKSLGINVINFSAYNCGHEVQWSEKFRETIDYAYLKNVAINNVIGEVMVTPYGIEGSLIYANSKNIQKQLEVNKKALIEIDLRPNSSHSDLIKKLGKKRSKDSRKNQLRKCLKLTETEYSLLVEILSKQEMADDQTLIQSTKKLKIHLGKPRPIDEAISTSGGIDLAEVDQNFESKKFPGLYFIGEMLDWDAPTGGYLLQGCFSIAHRAASSIQN